VCSHCSSGLRSGTTRVKAARGGGGAGDDSRRGRRRGRDGDGDFGFGPTVVESVSAAGGEEGCGVERRERGREGGRKGGKKKGCVCVEEREGEGGREGRKGIRTTDVSGD